MRNIVIDSFSKSQLIKICTTIFYKENQKDNTPLTQFWLETKFTQSQIELHL